VANAFFAAVTKEAEKDAIEAFETGNYKTTHKLFKQVSSNLMQEDKMLFLNINSDPGATKKQKLYFANDILRNDFTPGAMDKGGSASTQNEFQLYEEQCLKASLGASAKAQTNRHLSALAYGGEGARTIADASKKNFENGQARPKKPLPKRIARVKAPGDKPKPSIKAQGLFLKGKGQQRSGKKHAHIETKHESNRD